MSIDNIMKKNNRIRFCVYDDSYISYGNRVREVCHTTGTTPDHFVRVYDDLSSKFGLDVTEQHFQRLYREIYKDDFILYGQQKRPFPYISLVIDFILNLDYLREKCINISPIIKEFNECTNSYELHHVVVLSSLSAIYTSGGYAINFPSKKKVGKNPDININGINADLKVIHPPDMDKLYKEKGKVFTRKLSEDLCFDIGKAIENRLCIGIEQSDLVFIDLAAKSLKHMFIKSMMANYPDKYTLILPEPTKRRVVFFVIGLLPNNLNRRIEGELPYSFFGTYIDIDPNLWETVKSNKINIEYKRGEGQYIHFLK